MIRIGYKYECYVYVKSLDDGSSIFLLLYVDDMLIVANSTSEVNKMKILLSREFDMKVLERFIMENGKPISISLMNHFRLSIEMVM